MIITLILFWTTLCVVLITTNKVLLLIISTGTFLLATSTILDKCIASVLLFTLTNFKLTCFLVLLTRDIFSIGYAFFGRTGIASPADKKLGCIGYWVNGDVLSGFVFDSNFLSGCGSICICISTISTLDSVRVLWICLVTIGWLNVVISSSS